MATESALTLTASEQAELNRWFDSMAQNAPEGVRMADNDKFYRELLKNVYDTNGKSIISTSLTHAQFLQRNGLVMFELNTEHPGGWLYKLTLTDSGREFVKTEFYDDDTAASEPAYNPQTGWITKTEAEARAEFEDGWNAAEAERQYDVSHSEALDILEKRYGLDDTEPRKVLAAMSRQRAEVEGLQTDNAALTAKVAELTKHVEDLQLMIKLANEIMKPLPPRGRGTAA